MPIDTPGTHPSRSPDRAILCYSVAPDTGGRTFALAHGADGVNRCAARYAAGDVQRGTAPDTLPLGANSYAGFRGYWPYVADDPAASAENRELSRRNTAREKVVLSDGLAPVQTGPWGNTRVIRRADAHEQLAALNDREGEERPIFGSHTLWTDLLAHELVDEPHLLSGHVTVGGGRPIFAGPRPRSLRLIDTPRTRAGSDNILARHEVRPR